MNILRIVEIKTEDENGSQVVKKYPFIWSVYAAKRYAQLQPNYPINKIDEGNTPEYAYADMLLAGIEGGYKKQGKVIPDSLQDEINNMSLLEITQLIAQATGGKAEESEKKPEAKD